MLRWRIHYDDGSTFSNEDGDPEYAPGRGVLVIAQAQHDVGREILARKDFYYWERGRWWGADLYGVYDYLARNGWRKVIAGRNVEHGTFSETYERARLDPDLPAKSALLPGEVKP